MAEYNNFIIFENKNGGEHTQSVTEGPDRKKNYTNKTHDKNCYFYIMISINNLCELYSCQPILKNHI